MNRQYNYRRMWLGAMLAVMLLGACTKGEEEGREQVAFSTVLPEGWQATTSKGGVLNQTLLATGGFGVFAYYTGSSDFNPAVHTVPDFMHNTRVTSANGGTSWGYSPVKYWPNTPGERLSFFAYAPYYAGASVSGSSLAYTVPTEVRQQMDLSWSNADTRNLTKASVTGAVSFTFRHALAKVGFTVVGETNGVHPMEGAATITVKRVELQGFYQTGLLALNNTGTAAGWSSLGGSQNYACGPTHFAGGNGAGFVLTNANTVEAQPLNAEDAYLMVLPQDFRTAGFTLLVEYEVKVNNGVSGTESYTQEVSTPVKINLEAGVQYTLHLTLGLQEMGLAVTMVPWGEQLIDEPLKLLPDEN